METGETNLRVMVFVVRLLIANELFFSGQKEQSREAKGVSQILSAAGSNTKARAADYSLVLLLSTSQAVSMLAVIVM